VSLSVGVPQIVNGLVPQNGGDRSGLAEMESWGAEIKTVFAFNGVSSLPNTVWATISHGLGLSSPVW
jgi:hypothetical protein